MVSFDRAFKERTKIYDILIDNGRILSVASC